VAPPGSIKGLKRLFGKRFPGKQTRMKIDPAANERDT
jgi:hypothetical protein